MLSKDLNQPFPYEAYKLNYKKKVYIGVNWIVERLNEVLGAENWHHEFFDVNENMLDFSIEVLGKLSIYVEDRQEWISRNQYGNDTMTIESGETMPKPQARMDCKKSAVSDSLKKTAALFGAAADVYKNLIIVVPDTWSVCQDIIREYNLDKYVYDKGVPILPDSYKEYYEEQNWKGIFYSDLQAIIANKGNTSQPKSTTENKGNRATNQNKASDKKATTDNTTTTLANQTGNGPHAFRVKVLAKPVFNSDQTATFLVMLEDLTQVTCFASKQVAGKIKNLKNGDIVLLSGWYKEASKRLNIADRQAITVEKAA